MTFTILSPINTGISALTERDVDLVVQSRDEYEQQMGFYEYGERDAQRFGYSSGSIGIGNYKCLGADACSCSRADGDTGTRSKRGPGNEM